MITLHHETTRYTVQEANAQAYRAIIDSGKPVKLKTKIDRHHDSTRRDYPVYDSTMTTSDYVAAYARFNERLHLHPLTIAPEIDRAPPTLDATQPEVLEELDPDYVPTASKPKQTLATAKAAIHLALCALALGDAHKAEQILREVIA